MTTPDAQIRISADASGMVRGVQVAQGALVKLQHQLREVEALSARSLSFPGLVGIGISVTAATAALVGFTKAAADYGDQLSKASQRSGVAVEELSKLQFAAELSGSSAESLSKGMAYLNDILASAASGGQASAEVFEKNHIAIRNADGSMRNASEVMGDLADLFSVMPDGAQKTAIAIEFFGKKMGVDLIPLLNSGKAGMKALGDEAERLGLVISTEQAKAAEQFNDNLDRLAKMSKAAGMAIGNSLIPPLNDFLNKLIAARENKLSIGQILFDVLPDQGKSIADQIRQVTAEIDSFKNSIGNRSKQSFSGYTDEDLRAEIAKREKFLEYLKAQQKAQDGDEEASNARRFLAASSLLSKLSQLEKLRSIASGEASAEILKSDKELNAARLKDAEALRASLQSAYQSSVSDAKKAADEATALLDKARAKRTGAADKAFSNEIKGLSPEEQAAANAQAAQSLFDEGRYYAAAAGAAKLDGRLKEMESYAKKADEFLSRAESFAGQTGDTGLIQSIAEAQAQALEAQAKAKQQESADLQQRADAQMATLNALEIKIKEMTTAAANFEIKADMTSLEADIARIRKDIARGATMPIKIAQAADGQILDLSSYGPGYDIGGFTGWINRKKIAGFVHGMEFVTPANITTQPGVLPFLERLRIHGNKVLPGYETGGLVSRLTTSLFNSSGHSSGPSFSPSAPMQPVHLHLGDREFPMAAPPEITAGLVRFFRYEALRKGGRR